MLEDSSGTYKQSNLEEFPGYEYFYNNTKSGCMSSSGSIIPDSLLYDQDNKKATVKVSSSSKCYLYFDKYRESSTLSEYLIDNANLWQSGLEGDGYRYVGSGATCSYDNGNYIIQANNNSSSYTCPSLYNYVRTETSNGATKDFKYSTFCPDNISGYTYSCTKLIGQLENSAKNFNNFICFGTIDKSECINNQDKYMYRIIGVFPDKNGEKHVKLIKYKQLGAYAWNNDNADTDWGNSSLYAGLNGTYFLNNAKYNYLQNNAWLSKIENWTWSAVNTQTFGGNNALDYYDSVSPKEIYLHEMNRNNKTTGVGSWTNSTGKIGLMYVSDYLLSLGDKSTSITSGTNTNKDLLKTGWLHQGNNDTTYSNYEWTMSRFGAFGGFYDAWGINSSGYIGYDVIGIEYGVRPTFYLTSDIMIPSGSGNLKDPFILDNLSALKISVTKEGSMLNANIVKGNGNLTKYCINNSVSINDCTWKTISGTTITYTMDNEGTYYVHVIDDQGFIAHSSLKFELPVLSEYLIANANLWQSGLKGDGYRYVGSGAVGETTNPNNFICFGTTSKSDCTSNQDKYMYRIIGVFNDHVKLIKYKQLGKYLWQSAGINTLSTTWGSSDLYNGLNGEYFFTHAYYGYLQDISNKIADWRWISVITRSIGYSPHGADYSVISPKEMYLYEMYKSANTNTIGDWSMTSAKIGLMYASDYALSLSNSALALTTGINDNMDLFKTSWMHQSNNDTSKGEDEWTIDIAGFQGLYLYAWVIYDSGNLSFSSFSSAVRPVFYLESDVKMYSDGAGTIDNPYIVY